MAAGIRYRYKGRFVSEGKAARLANLKNASKYLTTEYTTPQRKTSRLDSGYKAPLEKRIARAIAADRQAAADKHRQRAKTAADYRRKERERSKRVIEQRRYQDSVRRVAEYADREDISVPEALDQIGFPTEKFEAHTVDEFIESAEDYLDYEEALFDFDMIDLEDESDEDKYKNK